MKAKVYFTEEEVNCNCGCLFSATPASFFNKVNTLRGIVSHPLRVSSWCRCPVHKLAVGSRPTSSHLKGLAVDLATPTEYLKYRILLAAGEVHFRGVGIAKAFIHLDDDPDKPPNRFWIY